MKKLVVLLLIGLSFCDDPFSILGIPSLNPSALFGSGSNKYVESNNRGNINRVRSHEGFSFIQNSLKKQQPKIMHLKRSVIPKSLEKSGLTSEDGIQAVSRYLLSENSLLKSIGAVFDKTQYSGLPALEHISLSSEERTTQKVKSCSNLYITNNLGNLNYEAYEVQENLNIKYHGWKSYKVLMVNKFNFNDHIYLTTCYPLDDMLCPVVLQNSNDCSKEIETVQEQLSRNSEVLAQIRNLGLYAEIRNEYDFIKRLNFKSNSPPNQNTNFLPNISSLKSNLRGDSKSELRQQILNSSIPQNPNIPLSRNFKFSQSYENVNKKLISNSLSSNNYNNGELNNRVFPHDNLSSNNSEQIFNGNKIGIDNFKTIEENVEKMGSKISMLESKLNDYEMKFDTQNKQIFNLQTNLDMRFGKLDGYLEKLSARLDKK